MIKQDKILAEARKIEVEYKKLRSSIFRMCEDMDNEKDPKQKEIICKAVKTSMLMLDELKERHQAKLNEAK